MLASLTILIASIGISPPHQEPEIESRTTPDRAVDGFLDRATLFPNQLEPVRVQLVEHDDSLPLPERKQLGKGLPFQFGGDGQAHGAHCGCRAEAHCPCPPRT